MKQVLFLSRIAAESTLQTPGVQVSGTQEPSELLLKFQAARSRHSACGVSSVMVRQGDHLLGVLEGGLAYVDRVMAALAKDGLLNELHVLADKPILCREYSEVALSLIEVQTLCPAPSWASKDLSTIDLRSAKRILKSLRAFHGLHAAPVRESHLRSVQVGPLRA
ncbi:hypothetical protein SAMN05421819_1080 [Bryocella elongata]|uniref:BLUF domain-containing protein n=1 Tax=Bryocella elongata TaxID=863522 RepID=A0A1H5UN62_9BACT|nr:BLUF domain-containing protein [Bryocella elongata]SEF75871.1 hypothetical protein SAMN05421819_1080 [Bryocella elongata]